MDHIIDAIEHAKSQLSHAPPPIAKRAAEAPAAPAEKHDSQKLRISDVEISISRLEEMRIVGHDPADGRSRAFDLLRTQLLQSMAKQGWRIVAITSPTPGCGKTGIAINLALSVARQAGGSVLLADLDVKKPQLAKRLGFDCSLGLRSLLEGRSTLPDSITRVSVGGLSLGVLGCERRSSRSSDWLSSPRMSEAFAQLKIDEEYNVVIVDLPPMLGTDDVLAILPSVDCLLMVAAAETTTTKELAACSELLRTTPVARVILNKMPDEPFNYD